MKPNFQSIKLTLILAITVTLIVSFGFGGWLSLYVFKSRLYDAYSQQREELTARVANTLAEPIANFSPQSGRLVIEAIKQDPSVVSVHVYDTIYDMDFVKLHFPSRASVHMFENLVDITLDGQTLGQLKMVYNDHSVTQDISEKKQLIIIIFSVVFLVTIFFMYLLVSIILFGPLRMLSRQAQNLRHNKLDQPVLWSRRDEISMVGQTLEGARQAIQNFVLELEERGEAYRHLSETDRLTGLANRYRLDIVLNKEIERRRRVHKPFGVIMIDIDQFKATNDTYGHHVGDQVLVKFAQVLTSSTREIDVVGRWGGEEFLVITLEDSITGLSTLAEKIRRHIEATDFPTVGHKTISLGVALHHENEDVLQLIGRADKALYEAKNKGRNTVVVAPAP